MKVQLFYFSGTGNTSWVSSKIQLHLKVKYYEVRIDYVKPELIKNNLLLADLVSYADIIGIGFPTYGGDAPKLIFDLIRNLPDLSSSDIDLKQTLVFCTELLCSGDGAIFLNKLLGKKGYITKWAVHILMPNNISIPQSPFKYNNSEARTKKILQRADKRVLKLVNRILMGRKWIQGRNPISWMIGKFQRVFFRLNFEKMISKWEIDEKICTRCMRCIEICPVQNISMKNDSIVYGDECNFCQRCYNFCPELAIVYSGKHHNLKRGKPYRGPTKNFKPENMEKFGLD